MTAAATTPTKPNRRASGRSSLLPSSQPHCTRPRGALYSHGGYNNRMMLWAKTREARKIPKTFTPCLPLLRLKNQLGQAQLPGLALGFDGRGDDHLHLAHVSEGLSSADAQGGVESADEVLGTVGN